MDSRQKNLQEVERAGLAFHTSRRLEGDRRLQDGQRSATVQASTRKNEEKEWKGR